MLSKENRESISDWLIVLGALGLFGSLFLTWSHQFSAPFLAEFGQSVLLNGVPRNPTAWQVYSAADVLLALLSLALFLAALAGSRAARVVVLIGVVIALAFTVHAAAVAPTNGANIFNPSLSVPQYASPGATSGPGETVALIALVLAAAGLIVSFTAD
jgi:hypothetical protein